MGDCSSKRGAVAWSWSFNGAAVALILVSCGGRAHSSDGSGGAIGAAGAHEAGTAGAAGATEPEVCQPLNNPPLEAKLRQQLSLGPDDVIGSAQLATVLGLEVQGLETLAGVECLPKLQGLALVDSSATDLSPIAGLSNLEELDIRHSVVPSLETLGDVAPTLLRLEISDSGFEALSDLAGMTSLVRLNLSSNGLKTLQGMPQLPKLESLNLDNNALSELSPLLNDPALLFLTVTDNQLESLSSLNGHATLWSVLAGKNSLSTLADLEQPALRVLDVNSNHFSELGSLEGLSLTTLGLGNNAIVSLSGIGSQKMLTELALDLNPLVSLAPLSAVITLQKLSLVNTSVSDLTPLATLRSIDTLNLRGTPVTDLTPLQPWSSFDGSCRQIDVTALELEAQSLSTTAPLLCQAHWAVIPVCNGQCFGAL